MSDYRLDDLFDGVEMGDMERAVPELQPLDRWFLLLHLRGYTLHPETLSIVLTRLLSILNGRLLK